MILFRSASPFAAAQDKAHLGTAASAPQTDMHSMRVLGLMGDVSTMSHLQHQGEAHAPIGAQMIHSESLFVMLSAILRSMRMLICKQMRLLALHASCLVHLCLESFGAMTLS